jgi:hypothetical protein
MCAFENMFRSYREKLIEDKNILFQPNRNTQDLIIYQGLQRKPRDAEDKRPKHGLRDRARNICYRRTAERRVRKLNQEPSVDGNFSQQKGSRIPA